MLSSPCDWLPHQEYAYFLHLLLDLLLHLAEGAHAADDVIREELLQPHERVRVLLEDLVAVARLGDISVSRSDRCAPPQAGVARDAVSGLRLGASRELALQRGGLVDVQYDGLEAGVGQLDAPVGATPSPPAGWSAGTRPRRGCNRPGRRRPGLVASRARRGVRNRRGPCPQPRLVPGTPRDPAAAG
eukprot:1193686-Prorocentrum_minimum.AAC.4